MHKRLKEFDFVHNQTADIGVTWPWTAAPLLENYSKYSDDLTCWLSGERSLPFVLLVSHFNDKGSDRISPKYSYLSTQPKKLRSQHH